MDNLMEQLASPENLLAAWRAVRGNIPKYRRARSAGPDGVTLLDYERELAAELNALRDGLLTGRYQPRTPARFRLPKRDGGEREVVVLAVADRVAQRAAQQVLEPVWEPEFLECSFGFRPGLSIDDAVACASGLRRRELVWVVDGDIAACFDSLDHDLLLARLRSKVSDRRVLKLAQDWLDAGVMHGGPPLVSEADWAGWERKVGGGLDRMMELTLGLDGAESNDAAFDPYLAARYEAEMESELPVSRRPPRLEQAALKGLALNGLALGLGGMRWMIGKVGPKALEVFKSPGGRRLLKRGAVATGGLAGVAAVAAVTTFLLQRKAGPSPTGALQGSPLSPLLANIYLHPFDVRLTERGHRLLRFADDWVILCASREAAEAAHNEAVRALAQLKLRVNPQKTRLLGPGEKLEWLGAVIK